MKCLLADCENEVIQNGKGRKSRYCSTSCKLKAFRIRKDEKRIEKLREQRSKLYIVPCDLDTANLYVTLKHRHNKAVPGAKFCLGVIDETGLLCGVAIVGRPVARNLDDGFTLEVNRVVTTGTPNACSTLYGAARKAAFELGYKRLVTYTLVDESGSSMRGAGWQKVAEVQASKGWHSRPGRAQQKIEQSNKWRWETINPEYTRNKQRPVQMILPAEMIAEVDHEQLELFA